MKTKAKITEIEAVTFRDHTDLKNEYPYLAYYVSFRVVFDFDTTWCELMANAEGDWRVTGDINFNQFALGRAALIHKTISKQIDQKLNISDVGGYKMIDLLHRIFPNLETVVSDKARTEYRHNEERLRLSRLERYVARAKEAEEFNSKERERLASIS